jgi:hypothetical protein
MGSFFTDAQKASLQGVMNDMHDTWKKDIRVFKEGKQIVAVTSSNYSHIYNRPLNSTTTIETIERTVGARIYYYPRYQDKAVTPMSTEDAIKLAAASAEVRIKVQEADYEFMKEVERIVLDGSPFSVASTAMPHGLFGSGFYTFILRRVS